MRRLFVIHIFPIAAFLLNGMFHPVFGQGCGTASRVKRELAARAAGNVSARTALFFSSLPGRVYDTPYFSIRYTMGRNVNRPRLTAQDSSGILKQADSIYNSLPASYTETQKDQAINQGLDNLGAPPPVFVQKAGAYFERAHSYYADSMGMTTPAGGGTDPVFSVSSEAGKFIVDIADITTVDPEDGGATYGLTFSPEDVYPSGSILLENDFLYNAQVNTASGKVTGTPIESIVGSTLIHNYAVDWEDGVKVTASHEFYHAVQYTYTPVITQYHAWYELSAVGMEERLAPEVNDYWQYLPCILNSHQALSLLSINAYPACGTYPMYGEGIFHQYLTSRFGKKFDVQVWSNLENNGDNLDSALTTMVTSFNSGWDSVYAGYTSALATAGRAGSASTCADSTSPIFMRDIHCWPPPSFDMLPALGSSTSLSVPALTFRLLKPASSGKAGALIDSGATTPRLIEKAGSNFSTVSVTGSTFILFPSPDSSVLFANFSSTSFSQTGQITVTSGSGRVGVTSGLDFSAFLNPATLVNGPIFFSAPSGITPPQILTIVSESGREVADLSLNADNASWTWNLKDLQNHTVQPGAYYYRIPGRQAKTLLILPH